MGTLVSPAGSVGAVAYGNVCPRQTAPPHPCKPFEKGLTENLFVGFCTV
ncbi:MAG: hypothetical protein IIT49_03315 [Clostridia bacterium]|nr:hypothetical protein [Clostridia bacterium]